MATHDFLNRCSACGAVHDAVSSVDASPQKPRVGDVLVCIVCGHAMAVAAGDTVEEITPERFAEIAKRSPEVMHVQTAIRTSNRDRANRHH